MTQAQESNAVAVGGSPDEISAVVARATVGAECLLSAHGKRAVLKCHGRGSFYLRNEPQTDHARWGDAAQIAEDIAHFAESGALPRGRFGGF